MRNMIALLIVATALATAAWALPAKCELCYVNKCYGDFECGDCKCFHPNGIGSEGFCG